MGPACRLLFRSSTCRPLPSRRLPAPRIVTRSTLRPMSPASASGIGTSPRDSSTSIAAAPSRTASPQHCRPTRFISRAIHQDDAAAFRAAFAFALASPNVTSRRVRIIDRDGNARRCRVAHQGPCATPSRKPRTSWRRSRTPKRPMASAPAARQAEAERALVERLSVATQAAGVYVWEFDWHHLRAEVGREPALEPGTRRSPLRAGARHRFLQIRAPGGPGHRREGDDRSRSSVAIATPRSAIG